MKEYLASSTIRARAYMSRLAHVLHRLCQSPSDEEVCFYRLVVPVAVVESDLNLLICSTAPENKILLEPRNVHCHVLSVKAALSSQ